MTIQYSHARLRRTGSGSRSPVGASEGGDNATGAATVADTSTGGS